MKRNHLVRGLSVALLLCSFPVFAETDPWLDFENGKRHFREGSYGEALDSFRDAVESRRTQYTQALARLDAALASPQAKLADGRISRLMEIFEEEDFIVSERDSIDAQAGGSIRKRIEMLRGRRISDNFRNFIEALSLALGLKPLAALDDSIPGLRESMRRMADFPEAEYWIGLVFMQEGEYELARLQFERARGSEASFAVPDDIYTVLYSLSELYGTRGERRNYESILNEVVSRDALFSDPAKAGLRDRMAALLTSSDSKDGGRGNFDRFVSLYRVKGSFALRAYDELGSYYLESGRESRALLFLAAAANAVIGNLIETIRADDPSYAYASLSELLVRVRARREALAYIDETGLYRILFSLGDALYRLSAKNAAFGIWSVLASEERAGVWRNKARSRLSSP